MTQNVTPKYKKDDYLTRTLIVALLASLSCLLWGSAVTAIKTGYRFFAIDAADTWSQMLFAGMRFTIAGIMVILFFSATQKKLMIPGKSTWKYVGMLSLVQTIGQYFFFYIGVAHATGVKSSIITGLGNFIAIIFSCLIFRREKMTGAKLFGCICGLFAVVLINMNGSALDMHMSLKGEGSLLMAQICYALSSVMIAIFSAKASPVLLSGYQFLTGGLVLIVVSIAMGGRIMQAAAGGIVVLVYLGFVSAMAYSLWSILLAHNPVSRVTIFGFVNPLSGVIMAALMLGETAQAFKPTSIAALILVCGGIYVVNRAPKMKAL